MFLKLEFWKQFVIHQRLGLVGAYDVKTSITLAYVNATEKSSLKKSDL